MIIAWKVIRDWQLPVVEQAVVDYTNTRSSVRLSRHPNDADAKRGKEECERFFRRDMGMYSDLDGNLLSEQSEKKLIRR